MKTSSKIVLIAAGIAAAFACIKKKGISGIGAAKIPDNYKRDFARRYFEDNFYTLNKVMPVERFIDLWVSGNAKAMANGVIKLDGKKYKAPATNRMISKLNNDLAVEYYGITFEVKPKSTQTLDYRWDDGEYTDRGKPSASTIFLHNNPKLNPIIGEVDYSDYDSARVISANGDRAIEFTVYGGDKGKDITVDSVYYNRMYPKDGLQWEYLSNIGTYKTLSGAIKAAKKYWDRQDVEYNPIDFENL